MADGFRVDASQLDALATQFLAAPAKLEALLLPLGNKTAIGIKRVMRKDASGHSHLPALPKFIEDDVDVTARGVEIEVGFKKEGVGNLANIAAYGSTKNAPVMDIGRGLDEEAPKFAAWLARLGAEAMR